MADGRVLPARLVRTTPQHDLAVLQVDLDRVAAEPVATGESADLKVGQSVLAKGNPLFGLDRTLTTGIISALDGPSSRKSPDCIAQVPERAGPFGAGAGVGAGLMLPCKDRTSGPRRRRPAQVAFDAVTAVHVADITVLARERPETPSTEVFPEKDVGLLHTVMESQGHREAVRMPAGHAPDIRAVVIGLGRLVGSRPSPRQPPPGSKQVRQGLERLNRAIQVRDAIDERRWEWRHRFKSGPLKARAPALQLSLAWVHLCGKSQFFNHEAPRARRTERSRPDPASVHSEFKPVSVSTQRQETLEPRVRLRSWRPQLVDLHQMLHPPVRMHVGHGDPN